MGFLLMTVSECCNSVECRCGCWPLGLLLPMGRGPVILRCCGLVTPRFCVEGRGEGVGVNYRQR